MNVAAFLQANFAAGLSAVDPLQAVGNFLPQQPLTGRLIVLGAGKGAARMARALEQAWPNAPLEGIVVTRYGHGDDCKRIEVVQASHPVPDAAGLAAAERILALAQTARAGDTVIALISGGGSSLLSLPALGISLADKQAINKALLASGAPIDKMNCVRSYLSAIKGGRLGAACGAATVHTLVLSDVPGDDPAIVASGPTICGQHTADDALQICEHYKLQIPRHIAEIIKNRPNSNPQGLGPRHVSVIATANHALAAATAHAQAVGWQVTNLGAYIEGEASETGRVLAGVARELSDRAHASGQPQLLLSGGETTVTVRHPKPGRGGRNSEFLLSAAIACEALPNVWGLAADTDGIDGSEDNAGAWFGPATLQAQRAAGNNPHDHLHRHDAYSFFAQAGSLLVTGPTRTNVNDFRAIAVLPPPL